MIAHYNYDEDCALAVLLQMVAVDWHMIPEYMTAKLAVDLVNCGKLVVDVVIDVKLAVDQLVNVTPDYAMWVDLALKNHLIFFY